MDTPFIHFTIGTKAQFIKMAPLMYLLEKRLIPYHLLDLSQHGTLSGNIMEDFGLAPPSVKQLKDSQTLIKTYWQAVTWFFGSLRYLLKPRRRVLQELFAGKKGIALIHGDTLSTLLGLYLARAAGLKTGLVEAGLTSDRLFNPFPEEFIRRYVEKRVDYLFAPGDEASAHLRRRYAKSHQIINTHYNTGKDALQLMLSLHPGHIGFQGEYIVITVHRLETIRSRQKLARIVEYIESIASRGVNIQFYMHPPTEDALKRFRMMDKLSAIQGLHIRPLLPYREFAHVLANAKFIITDGGSIQEEASYLAKPCVILRSTTERPHGLRVSAILTTWDAKKDIDFLHQERIINENEEQETMKAASIILDACFHAP